MGAQADSLHRQKYPHKSRSERGCVLGNLKKKGGKIYTNLTFFIISYINHLNRAFIFVLNKRFIQSQAIRTLRAFDLALTVS